MYIISSLSNGCSTTITMLLLNININIINSSVIVSHVVYVYHMWPYGLYYIIIIIFYYLLALPRACIHLHFCWYVGQYRLFHYYLQLYITSFTTFVTAGVYINIYHYYLASQSISTNNKTTIQQT